MKLQVQKSAQGPVLAKGEIDWGIVDVNGQKMAGGSYNVPDSPATINYGVTYRGDGTIGIQYSTPLGAPGSCC